MYKRQPLDDFVAFVTFHLLAFTKMRNTITDQSKSMNQFLQQDKSYLDSYYKFVITKEKEYKTFHNTQRNAVNRFNNLNHKTRAEANKRKQTEKDKGSRRNRFDQPITIYDFQIRGEVPTLMELKASKDPLNTVYNRILNNQLHNINFTNYKLFSEHLVEVLQKQKLLDDHERLLHQYLIEKNLHLHTLKHICKNYEKMKKKSLSDFERETRLQLMLYTLKMPMVPQWTVYIDLVCELSPHEFPLYVQEINSITNFIECVLLEYFQENEDIQYDEQDWIWFEKYVQPGRYVNDFRLRKDFSSATFQTIMNEIKDGNEQVHKNQ